MGTSSKAYQRIQSLIDPGSFSPIGELVTARSTDFNQEPKMESSDGCITGYAAIAEKPVYVYSQDASVLGGSVGEMHARKILNIYNLAIRTGVPVIGILDCAGMRLQEATDALYAFGRIYSKISSASGIIPQITVIAGNCGGGLALFPTLTDFTFMASEDAQLFVNAPNTLAGNRTEKCNTAGAEFQAKSAGLVDMVGSESEIFASVRELISILPQNNDDIALTECSDDLNRATANLEAFKGDTAAAIANIADNGTFFETKRDFAKEMVTGLIKLGGQTVGVVANRTEVIGKDGKVAEKFDAKLTADGCDKASDFVKFCDAFDIPVLTFTNVDGFAATLDNEKRIARSAAKLVDAFAGADVPKVNVIVGDAIGNAANVMNAKAIGADITFAWKNARVGIMESKLAAQIITPGNGDRSLVIAELDSDMNGASGAARRGYVDQIISADDTRKYVIGAFEMLYSKDVYYDKKHGTV